MRKLSLIFSMIIVTLAGCEAIQGTPPNARQILTTFCALHKADIFSTLLTPEQARAGNVVCAAIGMKLGSD